MLRATPVLADGAEVVPVRLRNVHLAVLFSSLAHGALILAARYRLSYDAYNHMFFGGKAELRGEVDIDALSDAFDALCQTYPVFAAHLEPDSEGNYYIVARADSSEGVAESFENNNTRASAVRIGADLVVSSLTTPAR